jgi:plasmid stabilization system protein ParE
MAEIRWTQQASDDLEAITEFIANDSLETANNQIHGTANRRP